MYNIQHQHQRNYSFKYSALPNFQANIISQRNKKTKTYLLLHLNKKRP